MQLQETFSTRFAHLTKSEQFIRSQYLKIRDRHNEKKVDFSHTGLLQVLWLHISYITSVSSKTLSSAFMKDYYNMIIYKIIKFKAGDWFESGSSTLDTALNQWSWEGSGRMTQELGPLHLYGRFGMKPLAPGSGLEWLFREWARRWKSSISFK